MKPEIIEFLAEVLHNTNRAFCISIGDNSQPLWENAPQWQKDSVYSGINFHLNNDVTPEMSHENWMADKLKDGWKYGPVKNPEIKEHPCMVPYNELPTEQRTKDYLFKSIIDTFKKRI